MDDVEYRITAYTRVIAVDWGESDSEWSTESDDDRYASLAPDERKLQILEDQALRSALRATGVEVEWDDNYPD